MDMPHGSLSKVAYIHLKHGGSNFHQCLYEAIDWLAEVVHTSKNVTTKTHAEAADAWVNFAGQYVVHHLDLFPNPSAGTVDDGVANGAVLYTEVGSSDKYDTRAHVILHGAL
jgi:hypothetical protein